MSVEPSRPNRHELIRRHNESLVLGVIGASDQPVSHAAIVDETGLSRPTVNLLVEDLCACGLLREAGIRTGVVGRPASLVEVNPDAGCVAAIAVDADGVTVGVSDLSGEIRTETRHALDRGPGLIQMVNRLVVDGVAHAGLAPEKLMAACVSEPGVSTTTGTSRALAPNTPGLDDAGLSRLLARWTTADVLIENDVNLAAIGEQRYGVAQGETSFALLYVDTGIGMGLMVNGGIWRGAHGAAGEAGFLPIGDLPLTGRSARIGSFELQAGAAGFLARYRKLSGKPRASLRTVWELGEAGDAHACEVVDTEADFISRAVLATAALIDPAFVVLGGAIGSNPLIVSAVSQKMVAISPYPIEVRGSLLGDRAAMLGALATGLDSARRRLGFPSLHA